MLVLFTLKTSLTTENDKGNVEVEAYAARNLYKMGKSIGYI